MPRLLPIEPTTATGKAKELLDTVQKKLGQTPNMMRTMATAPAVLDAYLSFSGALGKGTLGAKLGEQIALTVGQKNRCGYCVAAHHTIGQMVGLTEGQITASRAGQSDDPRTSASLKFARTVVDKQGHVSDTDVLAARAAGLNDGQIAEVVAHVALNIFTNYFNHVADPEVDFPKPRELEASLA